jgi:ribonuclease HI
MIIDIYTDRNPLDVTGQALTGIVFDDDTEQYTVLTAYRSKDYKTLKGAEKGLAKLIGKDRAAKLKASGYRDG